MTMSDEAKERSELVTIGALWTNKDREGRTYYSGKLGDARLLVFENKFKEKGDKTPDYRVYVANRPKAEKGDSPAERNPQAGDSDRGDDAAGNGDGSGNMSF
jgi:uncharacterized protein (DUF736 family)